LADWPDWPDWPDWQRQYEPGLAKLHDTLTRNDSRRALRGGASGRTDTIAGFSARAARFIFPAQLRRP
jgi:hypothetical protein